VDLAIRVPEADGERAAALLGGHASVVKVTAKGERRLEALVAAQSGNAVLAMLIGENIEILSFSQESVDLEALFLERTKGIIS
jgi:hypothetical protein